MEEKKYLDLLAKREIQPTAIRILILRTMMQAGCSVSLLDLETMLDTVDKSTIFRTLTLFLSHHLIHSIDDGTGSFKYAVCSDSCSCAVSDLHTHFHCEKCNKTFCFTNSPHSGGETASRIYAEQHQLCTERHLSGLCSRSQPECLVKNKNPCSHSCSSLSLKGMPALYSRPNISIIYIKTRWRN